MDRVAMRNNRQCNGSHRTEFLERPPSCLLDTRETCRWFFQSGLDACRVCPHVITNLRWRFLRKSSFQTSFRPTRRPRADGHALLFRWLPTVRFRRERVGFQSKNNESILLRVLEPQSTEELEEALFMRYRTYKNEMGFEQFWIKTKPKSTSIPTTNSAFLFWYLKLKMIQKKSSARCELFLKLKQSTAK